jgi:hypothetical protein
MKLGCMLQGGDYNKQYCLKYITESIDDLLYWYVR